MIATARRESRLNELVREAEGAAGSIQICAGDIAEAETHGKLLSLANNELGGLDLLINNAGVGSFGPFHEGSAEVFRKVVDVNLLAAAELTRASFSQLRAGHSPMVVFMGSVLGHFAVPLKSEYCATKFALRGLSESIRMEYRTFGIDVLMVSPSTTDSEFFDQALADSTKINWKRYGAMAPEQVATKTLRAIEKGKREIILTPGGKAITWFNRFLPGAAQRVLAKDAKHIGSSD